YLDVREALQTLGIDDALARELGLAVYKVALSWPLEPEGALAFCRGLEGVLVVEEKRVVIEDQLARLLYNQSQRPRLAGKRDAAGAPLVPAGRGLAPGIPGRAERRVRPGRRARGRGPRARPPAPPPPAAAGADRGAARPAHATPGVLLRLPAQHLDRGAG